MIAGRYTIKREIGRGGMGAVHLAEDEVLGREVAIKRVGMLPGAASPDLARAEREARLAASLNHPHVVSVFDLVEDQGQHWLVMEFVDGESLAERIRGADHLDHATVAHIIWQVADALTVAHHVGITHRDVKPSNILVTRNGQAKLSDFGIARAEADASLTQTGLVTGSPAYLAPEVASGAGANNSSDVWSLGATLFHALSGRAPYDISDNLIGGLYKIVHEEPPRLTDAGAFADVLSATMARDPADRWSMDHVRDRLAQIRDDPAAIGATSTRLPDSAATPTTDVLAAVPAGPATHDSAATPLAAQRRSRSPFVWFGAAALVVIAVIAGIVLINQDEPAPPQAQSSTPAEPSTEASTDPATEQEAARAATRKDVTSFITSYLATVTSDRRAAFAMLSPEFQSASGDFARYNAFWQKISQANASNIQVDPEALTVSYDVKYRTVKGANIDDQVSLQLQRVDDGYLVAGES